MSLITRGADEGPARKVEKRNRSYSHISSHLARILVAEFGPDVRICELFDEFSASPNYRRAFSLELIAAARGAAGELWHVRRVAVLMLQHQILKIPVHQIEELDSILVALKLKAAAGLDRDLESGVLKEGFTTTELRGFLQEFRSRLARHDRIYCRIGGESTSQEAWRDFIHLSRRDCKLYLARYLFSPGEVVDRILEQVSISTGVRTELPFDEAEVERTLERLPDFEASILRQLCEMSKVLWVSEKTSSEVNSLVEYPLGTVVLVVKPPGSDVEFEIKRAGLRGDHLINVVFRREGYIVPNEHRFFGISGTQYLKHDTWASYRFTTIHQAIHETEARLSSVVSILSKHTVPVDGEEQFIFDYLTQPEIFGAGFREMRAAMKEAVTAFELNRESPVSDLPGDLGLTVRFMCYLPPGQAILSDTSSFRLDLLAQYLSSTGDRSYFEEGLGVRYSRDDARRFADEVLEEVLGVYLPPTTAYRTHEQYLRDAFDVPRNRARADHNWLSAMRQIGRFWGTLLAIRGYSNGESFVARNVGLRSSWDKGRWQVEIIFMDHDNLQIADPVAEDFHSSSQLAGMSADRMYIFGIPGRKEPLEGSIGCLAKIYRTDGNVRRNGLTELNLALEAAYRRTHRAFLEDLEFQKLFSDRFVERIRDWDGLVESYLAARQNPAAIEQWRADAQDLLQSKGYDSESIALQIRMIIRYEELLMSVSFLFRNGIDHRER